MAAAAMSALLANLGTAAMVGLSAEGLRKGHVGAGIADRKQAAATKKAEDTASAQEAKNTMMRQEASKKAKMTQKEAVTKSPFAGKKKGNLRSQFTVGGGGSDSGVNY